MTMERERVRMWQRGAAAAKLRVAVPPGPRPGEAAHAPPSCRKRRSPCWAAGAAFCTPAPPGAWPCWRAACRWPRAAAAQEDFPSPYSPLGSLGRYPDAPAPPPPRSALGQRLHDPEGVEGPGQAQVRHLWPNGGVALWEHTRVGRGPGASPPGRRATAARRRGTTAAAGRLMPTAARPCSAGACTRNGSAFATISP
jgi:hypothetical protein